MDDRIPLTPRLGPTARAWLDARSRADRRAPRAREAIEGAILRRPDDWRAECERYARFYIDIRSGRRWPEPPPYLDDPPLIGDGPYPGLDANGADQLRHRVQDWSLEGRTVARILEVVGSIAWLGHQVYGRIVAAYLRGEPASRYGEPVDQPRWVAPMYASAYSPDLNKPAREAIAAAVAAGDGREAILARVESGRAAWVADVRRAASYHLRRWGVVAGEPGPLDSANADPPLLADALLPGVSPSLSRLLDQDAQRVYAARQAPEPFLATVATRAGQGMDAYLKHVGRLLDHLIIPSES